MIVMSENKNTDSTFDMARKRCINNREDVLVMAGKRPIMHFVASFGDFREIPTDTFKVSLAEMLVDSVFQNSLVNSQHYVSHRKHHSVMTTIGILKSYEDRGGKL